MADIDL